MAAPAPAADDQPLTERQKIIHVLNRLGFGPRPGDVEQVEKMGLPRYLQQQLHPESIDDSALQADLARFDTLAMDSTDLFKTFRKEQEEQKQRQREQAEAEKKIEAEMNSAANRSSTNQTQRPPPANRRPRGEAPRRSFLAVAELQNAKIISAVESPRQLY